MLEKICPSCDVVYMPTVERCADCGTPLETHDPNAAPADAVGTADGLELGDLVPLATGSAWHLDRQARGLQEAGISSRVDRAPKGQAGGGLCLYVRAEERESALRELREREGLLPPDVEPRNPEEELGSCPACSSPLAPGAVECGDCGLPFPAALSACSACGAEVDAEADRCPACGVALA
ncbi:MAG: zinc ribbon domain-containing protein [Proteobacteria bacterium]|nr:zinc ribbon domain-containing protein [Pseudomonadota bacterium]